MRNHQPWGKAGEAHFEQRKQPGQGAETLKRLEELLCVMENRRDVIWH